MKFRNHNFPGIIDFHITTNNHIFIRSITGGYVEQKDNGQYYSQHEVLEALQHRQNRIDKAYEEYQNKPVTQKKETKTISSIINPKNKEPKANTVEFAGIQVFIHPFNTPLPKTKK